MSRRKTKKEDIRNPEHYFRRYVALESLHDKETQNEYYKMFNSLDEMQENLGRSNGQAQLLLAVNLEGSDYENHLSKNSFIAWVEYIENPCLNAAISKLSVEDKVLLTLRFKYSLSLRQAAQELRVSHTAVRKQEKRIKKFILDFFEKGFQNP